MPHISNPKAEELLDKELKVLDKGFIRLVDYMGSDQRIVDSARVSYQGGTKKVRNDSTLLRYLLRHKHTTPFEKIRFEFHVKLPIFVARQWMRHRMGTFNELSARYSVMPDEFYYPESFRKQSLSNKQGSGEDLSDKENKNYLNKLKTFCEVDAYGLYQSMIDNNVARELARMVLPVNIYTEFYWTVDLWNLMHFMKLRSDSHAQLEIQAYSLKLEECVQAVCPDAYDAFCDYHKESKTLTRIEALLIEEILNSPDLFKDKSGKQSKVEYFSSFFDKRGMKTKSSNGNYTREFVEFLNKFNIDHDPSI